MKLLPLLFFIVVPTIGMAQKSENCLPLGKFQSIKVYNGIQVDLIRSKENKLCVDNSSQIADLQVTLENEALTLRKSNNVDREKSIIVSINYIDLKSIIAYNKSTIGTPKLVQSDSLSVVLKSGATFYGSFDINYLNANITEGCLFTADGYADEQIINVALKGSFSAFELEGKVGEVKATSGGIAKVRITEKLKATASTGGYIGYKESPKVEEKISLGGKIVNDKD